MKKTLIALAAVAATGAAFAQSSVTLSGTVDLGFQQLANKSNNALTMQGDRQGTSNWTLRGTEDLGGGLKGVFQISTAFNADVGTVTTANGFGNNGMFVGVEGGFGRLIAGRPVHILWGNVLSANGTKGVTGHATSSVLGGNLPGSGVGSRTGGAANAVYADNALQYFSPRFGGLQVQVEYAPSESSAAAAQDGVGVGLNYSAGPLALTFVNYTAANVVDVKAVNQIGAAYDFGVARLLFTYRAQGKGGTVTSANDTSYALGVTAPVGAGAVYASYNNSEQAGTDGRTLIAGYRYNLSKRTSVYAQLANRNSAWLAGAALPASVGGGALPGNQSTNGYGFGLQHNF
jgi:predicted porin